MEKEYKKSRFGIYLFIGILLLGGWGYINYTQYLEVEQMAEQEIAKNVEIIKEAVEDIDMEQNTLRMAQRSIEVRPESIPESMPSGSMMAPSSPAPAPPPEAIEEEVVDVLQDRIDQLEREKEYYLTEKGRIATEIRDLVTLFKIDVKNPLINIVFLPLVAYFFKKLIDLFFKRLSRRYETG